MKLTRFQPSELAESEKHNFCATDQRLTFRYRSGLCAQRKLFLCTPHFCVKGQSDDLMNTYMLGLTRTPTEIKIHTFIHINKEKKKINDVYCKYKDITEYRT